MTYRSKQMLAWLHASAAPYWPMTACVVNPQMHGLDRSAMGACASYKGGERTA